MSRAAIAATLFVSLVAQAIGQGEYVPPARRRNQLPVESDPAPRPTPTPAPDLRDDPAAAQEGPYVPPARRAGQIVAPRETAAPGPSLVDKLQFLSTLHLGAWGGARWRGKGTGASDGGAIVQGTLPSGWKPTLILGPRALGAALGYSRAFLGAEVASGKVFAVAGFEPLTW